MTQQTPFDLDATQRVIRDRIRDAIESSSLPSREVARISDYSAAHIRRLRNGRGTNPTIAGIWTLAEALKVNPHWLLGAPYVTKHQDLPDTVERKDVLTTEVVEEASRLFHVHKRDIVGPYRFTFLMPARFALCKALRERGLSYPHIGRIMNRDHSTVIYAAGRAEYMMERDPHYADKVNRLIEYRPNREVEQHG